MFPTTNGRHGQPPTSSSSSAASGACSGMGLAMAMRFATERARVIAGDWNTARLDAAVALIDLAVDTDGRIDVLPYVALLAGMCHACAGTGTTYACRQSALRERSPRQRDD